MTQVGISTAPTLSRKLRSDPTTPSGQSGMGLGWCAGRLRNLTQSRCLQAFPSEAGVAFVMRGSRCSSHLSGTTFPGHRKTMIFWTARSERHS